MRLLVVCRSCLFLLLVYAAAPAQAQGCRKPITLGTGQWEPYGYYDAQQRYTGVDAEMMRAIFKEAGCEVVEMPTIPAIRNLALFERGEIDMMTGASITPERLTRAFFSVPYRNETVGLFALADDIGQYRAIRSFPLFLDGSLRMLAPRAGWYGPLYDKRAPSLQARGRLFQFVDFAQGIRMLAARRANFIMGDAAAVEHAAARQGVKVQPLPFWVVEAPVSLMFNRATVAHADVLRIDAAIERLQKRGTLEHIRRSFGGM